MPEIFIDGRPYTVAGGQSVLQACLSLGFDLPYFCWHPAMGSVGACRQCAVKHLKDEHDPHGRMVMSCMTPVSEGARFSIAHPEAVAFRAAVIEGMMLHHPHDCPVCDEGGHCQLQDMTVMTGHNYRRYRFNKRTFRNQYLGPLLHHEMNRCIQCYRCVRFYREYAGGSDLEAQGISDRVFFGRQSDGVLENEFAGNLAEVCPTGVFTDATFKRHYTRKWDVRWAPSLCVHCGLGCNTSPGERYDQVRVVVNRYHGAINGYFLCDRGRYAYEYLDSPRRVRTAQVRGTPVAPETALAHLRALLAAAQADPPGRMIGIGSPRASLESNFVLRQLVGAERFYAGVHDLELRLVKRMIGLQQSCAAAIPSLHDIEQCDAALVLGEDITQSAARMALSLRQGMRQQPLRDICDPLQIPHWLDHAAREAIQEAHGPLFVLAPAATRLDDIATARHRAAPDDLARLGFAVARAIAGDSPQATEWTQAAQPIAAALLAAQRPLVISGPGCGSAAVIEAAAAVAAALAARGKTAALSFVMPEANTLGLALLGPRPLSDGLDQARFDGVDTAIVLETDLEHRAPAAEVEAFLGHFSAANRHLIVLDQLRHPAADAAELLLPAASWAEADGTVINNEGRAQRFFQVATPDPALPESWRWLEHGQGREATLDAVIESLASALPSLAAIRNAAPAADFRMAGQKVARETHRFSGRTAILANIAVSEPKPPEDSDAALSFSMEGAHVQPPAALTPYFWTPGWNSPQAQLFYQNEVNGPRRGGDGGVRVVVSLHPNSDATAAVPEKFVARRDAFWVLRQQHLFGSEELSREARAIAQLAPAAYIGLNPAAAEAAGWKADRPLSIELDGRAFQAPLRIVAGLADGLALVPAGFAAFDGAVLPGWCRITAAGGGGA
jgi:NADH-quinone oxidoreductase subunit G